MALNFIKRFFLEQKTIKIILAAVSVILIFTAGMALYFFLQNNSLKAEVSKNREIIQEINKELSEIKSQDPYKTNAELKKQIENIQKAFFRAAATYEDLLDLENPPKEIKGLDTLFANVLVLLGKQDYQGALTGLADIENKIIAEKSRQATAAAAAIPKNVPVSAQVPSSGSYSRQQVATDVGNFLVDIIAGDLASTRVIVDTASDSTCTDNCPVLPLATYVSRNGAYAGVNGTYFCPASYPSCAGKTNSFDLLLMNSRKTYFNSDNNVYSVNPGVIFGGSYIRFVSAVSQWGRDTGIDSMLSNYPLLVFGGNITFGGNDDPKQGSKGNRSFVANKGNIVYIGVVHSATVAESAHVMKAMGMENALNLDNGGSTALWSGGYKVGPGRDLPNVILFVKK